MKILDSAGVDLPGIRNAWMASNMAEIELYQIKITKIIYLYYYNFIIREKNVDGQKDKSIQLLTKVYSNYKRGTT